MSDGLKDRLTLLSQIIAVITPLVLLLWFIINLQIGIVKADVVHMKEMQIDHIAAHQRWIDTIPSKDVMNTQFKSVMRELEKIGKEIENCRANDKEFRDQLYKFFIEKKMSFDNYMKDDKNTIEN